jgi:hypothetical protein
MRRILDLLGLDSNPVHRRGDRSVPRSPRFLGGGGLLAANSTQWAASLRLRRARGGLPYLGSYGLACASTPRRMASPVNRIED